jgi:hypothetical protein
MSYLFECYYCEKFSQLNNVQEYLKHVVNYHNNKPPDTSKDDIEKII